MTTDYAKPLPIPGGSRGATTAEFTKPFWEATKRHELVIPRCKTHDGFFVQRHGNVDSIYGRFAGKEYSLEQRDDGVCYRGEGFTLSFDGNDPAGTMTGEAEAEVDLSYFYIMTWLRDALFVEGSSNYPRYC